MHKEKTIRQIYTAALTQSKCYAWLDDLSNKIDFRLSGSEGIAKAGLRANSQRYFDYHHATNDSFDSVNKRELELGAATMASLVYLIDQ